VTYEELMKSIDRAAGERKREMQEKAAAEAESIRRDAREEAVKVREEAMARAREKVAAEKERQMGRAREEARLELLRLRNEVFSRAFGAAGERVQAMRSSPSYPAVARRLAGEAIGLAGGSALVLHVDPRDRALFEDILADLGRNCDVAADLEGSGGLTVTTRDGKLLVTNTLDSRLSRAREVLKGEIFSILYGG